MHLLVEGKGINSPTDNLIRKATGVSSCPPLKWMSYIPTHPSPDCVSCWSLETKNTWFKMPLLHYICKINTFYSFLPSKNPYFSKELQKLDEGSVRKHTYNVEAEVAAAADMTCCILGTTVVQSIVIWTGILDSECPLFAVNLMALLSQLHPILEPLACWSVRIIKNIFMEEMKTSPCGWWRLEAVTWYTRLKIFFFLEFAQVYVAKTSFQSQIFLILFSIK